jgi:hypothetical protein
MEEVASSNLAGSTSQAGAQHPHRALIRPECNGNWQYLARIQPPRPEHLAAPRDTAQFGRARAWGARERWFKSSYPDGRRDPGSESLARAVKSARNSTAESSPLTRRSAAWLAYCLRMAEVGGSNPPVSTHNNSGKSRRGQRTSFGSWKVGSESLFPDSVRMVAEPADELASALTPPGAGVPVSSDRAVLHHDVRHVIRAGRAPGLIRNRVCRHSPVPGLIGQDQPS